MNICENEINDPGEAQQIGRFFPLLVQVDTLKVAAGNSRWDEEGLAGRIPYWAIVAQSN